MTKKQKKAYLKNSGKCPFCKSTDITSSSIEVDGDIAWQEIRCNGCSKGWFDYYKLFDVEEIV
jgi:phage FluMu protein Com